MKTTEANTSRHALRAGTRAGHDRVDAHFADGLRSDGAYTTYLRGMQAFVRGVDAAVARATLSAPWQAWASTPRAEWLQADLDALALRPIATPSSALLDAAVRDDASAGASVSDAGSRHATIDDAWIDGALIDGATTDSRDDARAAGALYVVEGSALGARSLLGDAQRLGHDAAHGAMFLSHHAQGDVDGRRWPRFAAALGDAAFAGPACQAGMLHAANAAFAHADACFRAAADATPDASIHASGLLLDLPATARSFPARPAPSPR